MTIGNAIYRLDPTLAPVRPRWSLPLTLASQSARSSVGSSRRGR
jgi:hypothetical protein